MPSLLPRLVLLPLLAGALPSAMAQVARPAQPSPCQTLSDPAVAAECQKLAGRHSLMPQVVAVCGRLGTASLTSRCLHAAQGRLYSPDAIDWCSQRPTAEDVVQCFTLTGGSNRPEAAVASSPPPAAPPKAAPKAAPAPAPLEKAPVATEMTRKPLPTGPSPRGPSPEVMQPTSHRPPPSTLDRVGNDVRSVVEGPGSDWLERVGRDVRGGAQTVGGALKPRPQNDPAYGPGAPSQPATPQ